MQKSMHLRMVAIAVAVISVLLLAAACGGGDDDGDADPTATASAGGEPTAAEPTAGEPTDAPAEPTDAPAEPTVAPTEPAAVETTIDVTLSEFAVEPSEASVPAGTVTFNISNNGVLPHNFRVFATDLAPDGLPTDEATFMADEAQLDVRASGADLNAGETEDVSVALEAGSYVLICNVPTHYGAGMRVELTVE